MKIWYQSASSYGYEPVWDSYGKALEEKCKSVAAADTEVHVAGIPCMIRDVENWKYVQYLQNIQTLKNMRIAEMEGYDAFVIGCTLDVGLQEGRGMLEIPVIGISEASYHLAMMLGKKFTFVTSSLAFVHVYEELIERYGLNAKYLASRYIVPASEEEIAQSLDSPDELSKKFISVAKQAARDGASVIIPAPAFYCTLAYRAGIHEIDGAVVLDSISVALKTAEFMVSLKTCGISPARLAGVYAKMPPNQELRALAGLTEQFHL